MTVIIAAGGAGLRFGAETPKQFLDLGGRSMLAAATEPFLRLEYTDEIVVVVPEAYVEQAGQLLESELGAACGAPAEMVSAEGSSAEGAIRRLRTCAGGGAPEEGTLAEGPPEEGTSVARMPAEGAPEEGTLAEGAIRRLRVCAGGRETPVCVVPGGEDRAASVRAGLEAASGKSIPNSLVLIHDAARPFVTADLIGRVLEAAQLWGAAIPTLPVPDTIYTANEEGFASSVLDRGALRAVQTPQGFDFALIREAHDRALAEGLAVTDDGTPVIAGGKPVVLVEGGPGNNKITTADDIALQAGLRRGGVSRVGVGFDAHRFGEGRPLVIGGVVIPFEKGLAGHSDADVLTHALMDAVLGALREGDIGKLFPDKDPAYAGASSIGLLGEVVSLMRKRGYEVVNADMTIVAERPRFAPYSEEIERRLADALGTAPANVSVKATTTEKLGFTGREEGIAAEAVVLLQNSSI